MNEDQIAYLKKFPIKIFQKGENIITQGDPIGPVYYLSHGICTRNFITDRGDEIIYDKRAADGTSHCLLGVLSLFLLTPSHNTNITAQTECICHTIPSEDLRYFLKKDPEILSELLVMAVNRYHFLNLNFISKQKRCTANRVCSLISDHLVEAEGNYYLSKQLNNTKISKYLGVHRMTIVKIMKQLRLNNIIKDSPDGYQIINLEQLMKYARDEETLKYTDCY
ncbi:MAG: Crp/Fnr family transcriptional regulator [Peptococcaceae bacterium]|nr:Crp/Fnr family transcriptional regulator [Peptococcaceae bacterium]